MKLSLPWRASLAAVPLLLLLPASGAQAAAASAPGCSLPSAAGVKHVVYVQFDNVHLRRDNPNVPSDLEQMPNLLNFLQGGGAMLDNNHTPLISHTADDILTSITGVYGDRQGNPVANSYLQYGTPAGTAAPVSSFGYWTDRTPNGTFNMLSAAGRNAPAPWVPFTRAGCNVGAVGMANIELEGLGDVAQVYGPNSPQAAEVNANSPNAFPDFVGIAVHCAKGAGMCATGNTGIPDVLPQEPGGYAGFNGLFGHRYVAPQISSGPLTDLDGNVIADRFNGQVTPGFPGFDGLDASVSLGYTAAMQEHGVPITYSYISAAHVDANGNDAGPGQADYVARLHSYDQAWGKFFTRLQHDGIDRGNTLFVVTSDENDRFAGGPPSPAGCDGVHTPCTYAAIGEVNTNLQQLMQQAGSTTPFAIHADTAPAIYLDGQPARGAAVTRAFERTVQGLRVTNPLTGQTEPLVSSSVDPVAQRLLHMVTADPARTPTYIPFTRPNFFVDTSPASCPGGPVVECPPSFGTDAWLHGNLDPQINRTWLGLAGPGVRHVGRTSVWADHTDIRPTMLLLAGLRDSYASEGRPLFELLTDHALPASLRTNRDTALKLAQVFKQINAPVGALNLDGIRVSTRAIASGSAANDATYAAREEALSDLTTQRDQVAAQIESGLSAAAFNGRAIDQEQGERLLDQSRDLLDRASELASSDD
jgi:hypothetical protein